MAALALDDAYETTYTSSSRPVLNTPGAQALPQPDLCMERGELLRSLKAIALQHYLACVLHIARLRNERARFAVGGCVESRLRQLPERARLPG